MVDIFGLPLSMVLLLAGAGLMLAEALAPGANFIVLGSGLTVAGLVGVLLSPLIGGVAIILLMTLVFLLASGATLAGYRRLGIGTGGSGSKTTDSSSLRGNTGTVTERVTSDGGEVKLDDGGFNPYYRARAMDRDIEVGTEVVVMDPGGGNVVTVAPANEDDIDRALREAREQDRAAGATGDAETNRVSESDGDADADGGSESDREPESA
ncbi:NfeD family protein [Halosegnis longus]|uniref:NfeD family protein n=1 Tax=Halosegnis longus TaxID=2216012 RepID=A0AAJ4R8Z6_9EURY|nr:MULTISPECIES: NfeD family protein [Halobacteriales]RNJ26698.1 NfeD family protein [Salella cibi]